jgi:hypothetical protein
LAVAAQGAQLVSLSLVRVVPHAHDNCAAPWLRIVKGITDVMGFNLVALVGFVPAFWAFGTIFAVVILYPALAQWIKVSLFVFVFLCVIGLIYMVKVVVALIG